MTRKAVLSSRARK